MRKLMIGIMLAGVIFAFSGCVKESPPELPPGEEAVTLDDVKEEEKKTEKVEKEDPAVEESTVEEPEEELLEGVSTKEDEPLDSSNLAGSYVRFYVDSYVSEYDTEEVNGGLGYIIDDRLIINEDGSVIYSGNDEILAKIEGDKLVGDGGYEESFKFIDGVILFSDGRIFAKSNAKVFTDDEISMARTDYMYPSDDEQKANPGEYIERYYEEYDGEDTICYSKLIIHEDGTAETEFQDVGPELESVKGGLAITKDKEELKCLVSHDVIAIDFDNNGTYTIFVKTEE